MHTAMLSEGRHEILFHINLAALQLGCNFLSTNTYKVMQIQKPGRITNKELQRKTNQQPMLDTLRRTELVWTQVEK